MSDTSSVKSTRSKKRSSDTSAKPPHRYRNCGTPVRTGCRTCKIRRVKCGEEKPFCTRCTSTGRNCDGYEVFPSSKKRHVAKSSPAPLPGLVQDPMESQMLDFYRLFTAPELSGSFSIEFWEERILQVATIEPSIRHITLALGALHKHYCERHQDISPNDGFTQAFAFRQYTRAISTLRNSIVKDPQSLDVTLISCILLICFDCLVGDHTSAMIHLNSGMRIMNDMQAQSASSTVASRCVAEYSPLLLTMGICALADPNDAISRRTSWDLLKKAGTSSRSPFRSLEDARHALQTYGVNILSARFAARYSTGDNLISTQFGPMAPNHQAELHDWSRKFDTFLDENKVGEKSLAGVSLLKSQYILFSLNAAEPYYPDHNFEDILDLSETWINSSCSSQAMPRLMIGTGIIIPLAYTALKSPQIKHKVRANELLHRAPGREGLWNTELALRLVENELTAVGGGA